MNVRSVATASGAGTASGFATSTKSPLVAAIPWLTFAANGERPSVAQHARSPRLTAHAARQVLDQHELVHLWQQLRRSSSTSTAWPCETTTAETLTASSR